ncbi:MAG: hypothetical protein V3U74_03130 [Thermodesulfobacteriota bacterium]
MGRGRKTVRGLYRTARIANDIPTLFSVNPSKILKRLINKLIGRKTGRLFRK